MILRRRVAKLKRQKTLYDFASAKSIGLLCSPNDVFSTVHLKDFLNYLSHKKIKYSVFGYFDGKTIPENFLYLKDFDFITQQELNFWFIPKGPTVDKFINEPFDMLIDCNINSFFPIEYISHLSKAKCKVGVMRQGSETCYDLMIDITKNKTLEYYLENLGIYLTNLRQAQ